MRTEIHARTFQLGSSIIGRINKERTERSRVGKIGQSLEGRPDGRESQFGECISPGKFKFSRKYFRVCTVTLPLQERQF